MCLIKMMRGKDANCGVNHALTVVWLYQHHDIVPLAATYPKFKQSASEAISNLPWSLISQVQVPLSTVNNEHMRTKPFLCPLSLGLLASTGLANSSYNTSVFWFRLLLSSLSHDADLISDPRVSSDSPSFWFYSKENEKWSGRVEGDLTLHATEGRGWRQAHCSFSHPLLFFSFLSFLLSWEGLLFSLSWLISPHLEANHCFMLLLNEEASFETYSLAAHDRGQEEKPCC